MELSDSKRNSGIAALGDLPWGSHFCQFYETKEELLEILVPYFKAGLENNELCVWVVSDFLTRSDVLRAMGKNLSDFSGRLALGHMEIVNYVDLYFKDGSFNRELALKRWMDKYNEALERGVAGLRISGDACWLDSIEDWKNMARYEDSVNNAIGNIKLLALCTYSMDMCGSDHIVDVMYDHQCALVRTDGAWQVIKNPGE